MTSLRRAPVGVPTVETLRDWLHTGDMARADDEGYFYIVDRKKDMIVSGGFNVFSREIEGAHRPPGRLAVRSGRRPR